MWQGGGVSSACSEFGTEGVSEEALSNGLEGVLGPLLEELCRGWKCGDLMGRSVETSQTMEHTRPDITVVDRADQE